MKSLLKEFIMPDETPTGDKAVYVFIEMIALGFILYAIEEAFKDKPSWAKVGLAGILGLAFFVIGVNWAKLKDRLRATWVSRIVRIANDYRYRYGLALLLIGVAGLYTISSLHSLRSDLDAYIAQRTVTKEQTDKLVNYLSRHEPSTIYIRVVRHDQEAMSYAAQLVFAMQQTNWDVNPPDHSGPLYLTIDPYMKRPKPDDVDSNGKRLYKDDLNAYLDAHDEWVESEIRRSMDENFYEQTGVDLYVQEAKPTNPDPRHPTPDQVLWDAMQYAQIEVEGRGGGIGKNGYKLFLTVGHKPRAFPRPHSLESEIDAWFTKISAN